MKRRPLRGAKHYYSMKKNPDSGSDSRSSSGPSIAVVGSIAIVLLGVVTFAIAQTKANQNAAALNAQQQGVALA